MSDWQRPRGRGAFGLGGGGRGRGFGQRGGQFRGGAVREYLTDSIYVGQLSPDIKENDLKKLFPKAKKVTLVPADANRPGHAFVNFPDDASAAAAMKQGATFKNTSLRLAFQTKRAEPQKRPVNSSDPSGLGSPSKKLKTEKGAATVNGLSSKGKAPVESDDDDSMDFNEEDDSNDDDDDDDSDEDDQQEKKIRQTVAKLIGGAKSDKRKFAASEIQEDDDEDDDDESDEDDDDDSDSDSDEEEGRPSSLFTSNQAKVKAKLLLNKPPPSASLLANKNKSGSPTKKLKTEEPVGKKNLLKRKVSTSDDDSDEDDDSDKDHLPKKPLVKATSVAKPSILKTDPTKKGTSNHPTTSSSALGNQLKPVKKLSFLENDDDDSDEDEEEDDDDESDDDDDDEEEEEPQLPVKKPIVSSNQTKSILKPSVRKPEEDSDDDDDDDPPPVSKLLSKQAPTIVSKSPAQKPAVTKVKEKEPTTDRPLNKLQLYINSIKESVTVADMKSLYPKATFVKLQKRKVGPTGQVMQFAFVTFDNESDCARALKAHTRIAENEVHVSYSFAKTAAPQPTPPAKKQEAVQEQTPSTTIYVGQLPESVEESDLKKLFPKSTKIELKPAKSKSKGGRPGFAFVTFPSASLAAAAVKLGGSLKLKNSSLKVAYQTKRPAANATA